MHSTQEKLGAYEEIGEYERMLEGNSSTPITCKDCKHSHMTTDGKHCKWCSIMATHEIDSDGYVDPPNGYNPQPYFDADFFCGFAERREA